MWLVPFFVLCSFQESLKPSQINYFLSDYEFKNNEVYFSIEVSDFSVFWTRFGMLNQFLLFSSTFDFSVCLGMLLSWTFEIGVVLTTVGETFAIGGSSFFKKSSSENFFGL